MNVKQNVSFKIACITLGCPKNQVDSEVVAGRLLKSGMTLVGSAEEADAVLINTCGFIDSAKEESIQVILETLDLKKHRQNMRIYVWGCLAERYRGEIEKQIPEVDGYFGIEPFRELERLFSDTSQQMSESPSVKRVLSTPSHTAYLKISEGCDHHCTFCSIPNFKGSHRSRPLEMLIEEAEDLVNQGVSELTLVSQDTTKYGLDWNNGIRLPDLLKALSKIDQLNWIRVMYSHPLHVTEDLIHTIASNPKICNYLDMPIQHISDSVLVAMGRGTSGEYIETLIKNLRSTIPFLTLRTAVIVGFPGETRRDFQSLLDFIESVRFERLGAFIFSREEGTAAYDLGPKVERSEAEFRYSRIMEVQQIISSEKNETFHSKIIPVLIDGFDDEKQLFFGRTEGDALDVDQMVWVQGLAEVGKIVSVQIDSSSAYDLIGRISTR